MPHMFSQIARHKKMSFFLFVLFIGIIGYWHFTAPPKAAGFPHGGMSAPVSVAEVVERQVQKWNEFSGRLVAVDTVQIRPQVSGIIHSIHFNNGEMVKKGDILFKIDPRSYVTAVAHAEGVLASAQAQLTLSKDELTRAERLIQDKVISQSEFDSRKNAVLVNTASVKSAQAALSGARLKLEYTEVRAPISGKISRAEMTAGNLVEADFNAPILATVVSSSPIYADFEVDERTFLQYVQARVTGQDKKQIPVMMGLLTESELPRTGFIESFDNHLNTTSGTIRVRAIFNNADGTLVPGFFVKIKVGEPVKAQSLLITDRAIGTDQNKKFVFVVDKDNLVGYREVKLGTLVDGLRVVEEGLSRHDKIIVNGLQRARPGQTVAPELVSMEPEATKLAKE